MNIVNNHLYFFDHIEIHFIFMYIRKVVNWYSDVLNIMTIYFKKYLKMVAS